MPKYLDLNGVAFLRDKINEINRNIFFSNEGISLDIDSLNIEDVTNVKEIN